MDCLLVGEESTLAQHIKAALPRETKLFCTSRRRQRASQATLTLDLEQEAAIDKFSVQTHNGFAVLCAAMSGVAACEQDAQKSFLVNVTHTLKLAEKLTHLGWKIIYPSSTAVFDAQCAFPRVDALASGMSMYGMHKREVERALLQLPRSLVIRFTKILPHGFPLFCHWLDAFERGETVRAFSDYEFSPVSAEQAASTLVDLVEQEGVWHVGAPDLISYEQAARVLRRAYRMRFPASDCNIVGGSIHKSVVAASACIGASLDCQKTEALLQRPFASSEEAVRLWFDRWFERQSGS